MSREIKFRRLWKLRMLLTGDNEEQNHDEKGLDAASRSCGGLSLTFVLL